jgi:hypothetical protein
LLYFQQSVHHFVHIFTLFPAKVRIFTGFHAFLARFDPYKMIYHPWKHPKALNSKRTMQKYTLFQQVDVSQQINVFKGVSNRYVFVHKGGTLTPKNGTLTPKKVHIPPLNRPFLCTKMTNQLTNQLTNQGAKTPFFRSIFHPSEIPFWSIPNQQALDRGRTQKSAI